MTSYSASAAAPAQATAAETQRQNAQAIITRHENKRAGELTVKHYQRMGARSTFDVLRQRLLASRPIIGERRVVIGVDSIGRKRYRKDPEPIYGPPTFRNKIDESGNHV